MTPLENKALQHVSSRLEEHRTFLTEIKNNLLSQISKKHDVEDMLCFISSSFDIINEALGTTKEWVDVVSEGDDDYC